MYLLQAEEAKEQLWVLLAIFFFGDFLNQIFFTIVSVGFGLNKIQVSDTKFFAAEARGLVQVI